MSRNLHRALHTQKKQTKQSKPLIAGSLGVRLGGTKLTEVPNRPSFLYVRLRDNPSEVIQAFNNKVSPSYDLPVLLERQDGRYVVVSVDTVRYQSNWPTPAPFLPRHGNSHSFNPELGGGGDIVWVQSRQFVTSLLLPSGSMGGPNVLVNPYTLQNSDGTWKQIGNTGTASMLSYIPSTGTQAVMVLVYLDTVSGNPYLMVGSGTYFANTITGSSQVLPYVPPLTNNTFIPLGAVRLVSGTSSIGWDNIYDTRQFFRVSATGTGGGILDAPFDGSTYGRNNGAWVIVSGTGGGGGDATYLRLDTTNDPLTGQLQIITSTPGAGGIYIETKGNDFSADIEQYASGSTIVTSPTLFLYRAPLDSTAVKFTGPMLDAWQDRGVGGSITGSFIRFRSDGTDRFIVNPSAIGTGTNVMIDGDFSLSSDASLLVVKNNGSPKTKIAAQGNLEFGLSSAKEANAGKIGYELFGGGYLHIVGAGTTAGNRWTLVYDKLKVSDHLQTNTAQLLNLPNSWAYLNGTGTFVGPLSAPENITPTGSAFMLGMTETFSSVRYSIANVLSLTGPQYLTPIDGWIPAPNTFTFQSADSPSFLIQTAGNSTGIYTEGSKMKLTQSGADQYFFITQTTYTGTNTNLNLYGGTGSTLSNTTISNPYYSRAKSPAGFPTSPAAWTITITDTANNSQASPVAGTYYNLGSVTINVPIGAWNLGFQVVAWDDVTGSQCSMRSALSTSASSLSDATFQDFFVGYGTSVVSNNLKKTQLVMLQSKTKFYLITTTGTSGVVALRNRGDVITTELKAVCAYL